MNQKKVATNRRTPKMLAMPETSNDREARFHVVDEADVAAYRAVSKPAIVAALLGLLSFTAMVHPLLLILPLVAIVAALLALRAMAANTTELTGRRLALVGMALGVFFGSAAVGRLISRDTLLVARAQRVADDWLQLARENRREEAYEMTLSPKHRQPEGSDLAKYYASSAERNKELQQYFSVSPVRELFEHGGEGKLEYEETVDSGQSSYYGDLVSMKYVLEYGERDAAKKLPMVLVAQRSRDGKTSRGQWVIHHVGEPEEGQR
jgi:hypothetical protein